MWPPGLRTREPLSSHSFSDRGTRTFVDADSGGGGRRCPRQAGQAVLGLDREPVVALGAQTGHADPGAAQSRQDERPLGAWPPPAPGLLLPLALDPITHFPPAPQVLGRIPAQCQHRPVEMAHRQVGGGRGRLCREQKRKTGGRHRGEPKDKLRVSSLLQPRW